MPKGSYLRYAAAWLGIPDYAWDRIEWDRETNCLSWQPSPRDQRGYARMNIDGTRRKLWWVSYESLFGQVPPGLVLDHMCRNPACVNPIHMASVTPEENNNRRVFDHVTHCKRGHEYTDANTYRWGKGRRVCRACHALHERNRRAGM